MYEKKKKVFLGFLRSWALSELSWSHLGALLGSLGTLLEFSCSLLGPPRRNFGVRWSVFRCNCAFLEMYEKPRVFLGFLRSGALSELSWRHLGALLDSLGTFLELS